MVVAAVAAVAAVLREQQRMMREVVQVQMTMASLWMKASRVIASYQPGAGG